jgi:hypothetical protein
MNNRNSETFNKLTACAPVLGLSLVIAGLVSICLMLCVTPAWSSEMILQLSGDVEYPGVLSLKKGNNHINRLCFVGVQGKGQVDRMFVRKLAQMEIPSGDYRVTGPLPQENWPSGTFLKNGALRLQPVSQAAQDRIQDMGRKGVAIHGRDFYPIVMPMAKKKELVDFYGDLLFERLTRYWGTLRITNWDMDRLHDFWSRNTVSPDEWQVHVRSITTETIHKLCKPPVVKRKPD